MAFDSLGQFVHALRRAGELVEVRAEVDPHLEISEISDRAVKAGGPALLFSNVRGSRYPVLTNHFGTERRMALAFGAVSLDDVAGWGAMLADALRDSGGELSREERSWADNVLGVTNHPGSSAA